MSVDISLVIPVYRSGATLENLVQRLERSLDSTGRPYEVIFVDDRSPDDSWSVLKELKTKGGRRWMKLVRLLKNSGQHNALLCAFSQASGNIVITMDDDLQHPPEELPHLIAAVDAGADLVVGAYEPESRKGFSVMGGRFIDATLRRIFKLPPNFKLTSFRAMRGVVARQVAQMSGAYPYVTAMVLTHATRVENVEVAYAPRVHGVSNYNLFKSLQLSLNLLLYYSPYPLYVMAALCFGSLTVFGGISAWVLALALGPGTLPGWASTLLTLAFSNTVLTLALLVQFLYLSRISHQVARSRVNYAIGDLDE
jgi:glycosyltransferase involved in cell wall biosynthesis